MLFMLLMFTVHVAAMDRWSALAMFETGNNDRMIGRAGEISRYQIRPELWLSGNPLNPRAALANAQQIMSPRVAAFERTHGRTPDDFEFYILWNAPAQINHPHSVVAERARRFVNLVVDASSEPERGRSASAQPRRTATNAI
jgi:hypothetical protein